MRWWWQDARYSLRSLAHSPGFAIIAVLTLAAGIGANTAVFSLVDGIYLRPWPVRDPGDLISISTTTKTSGGFDTSSFPNYLDIRNGVPAFSGVAAEGQRGGFISGEGQGQLISVDVVSENYFGLLGVQPALGRYFSPNASESSTQGHEVVLSYALWQARYGSDRALGKSILLDGRDFTIIGVVPRDFVGLEKDSPTDVWVTPGGWTTMVPGTQREFQARRDSWFTVIGRLRPGARLSQAQAQLGTLANRLANSYPADDKDISFRAIPATQRMRQGLGAGVFLMGMVGLVLLIACANVAGLLLARAENRRKEVAIRLALGAGRLPLLSQLVVESLLLALAGGALGLVLASWLLHLLPVLASLSLIPAATGVRVDSGVFLFTVAVSLFTAVLLGVAPGFASSRGDLVPLLKGEEPRLGGPAGRIRLRSLLVACEVALSVVLLVSSGLLLRSLRFSQRIRPGFNPHANVLMLTLAPPVLYGYSEAQAAALYSTLAGRFAGVPGVVGATYARRPPISDSETGETFTVTVPGREPRPGNEPLRIRYNIVSPGFFAAIGARLLRGRDFERSDIAGSTPVIIINEEMARELWPNQEAIGHEILLGGKNCVVIGVVETGRYVDLHEPPEPYLFVPYSQHFSEETVFFVRSSGDAESLVPSLLAAARTVDKKLPVVDAITLSRYLSTFLAEERASAELLAGLGALGIFLAAVGLYAVIAWVVQRRTREIGIRMALGARPADILRLALGEGIRLAAWGAAVGFLAALAVARLMAHRLYGIKFTDPLTYLAAIALAIFIALLASSLPARRAMRLHPMVALRYE